MSTRWVDESELLGMANIVRATREIMAHPQARKMLLNAQKIVSPNAVIPEIDAAAPVHAAIEEIRAELAAARQEREEESNAKKLDAFKQQWEEQRQTLLARYDAATVEAIQQHAEAEGIPSLRVAAADWEKHVAPARESGNPFAVDIFNPSQDADEIKRLMETRGDDERAVNTMIGKALADARRR